MKSILSDLVKLNVPVMVKKQTRTHTHRHTHTPRDTHLSRPCGCSSTRLCGSGLGWSARPLRRWCLPGSKWRGRSGSSGTLLRGAAPCPPLWWPGGPRGRAGSRCPGGLAFWNTRPVSEKDMQMHICVCVMKVSFFGCPIVTLSFWIDLLPGFLWFDL